MARHERECGERWRMLMQVFIALISTLIVVCGWGLVELWNGQQEQLRELRSLSRGATTEPVVFHVKHRRPSD